MIRWLLILSLAALFACSAAEEEVSGAANDRTVRVSAATPTQRDIDYVLTALGSVESINDPTVSAETAGQAIRIEVREGDTVAAGQLLVALAGTLHAIETAKAEAELRRADVLLDNQEKEVARLKRLDETQSVSRDALEDEQAQLEILRAQRDVARKQWEQAVYLETKTQVRAPLDGLVTRRHVSRGDFVTSGQALFELVSIDRLRARIAFPEHEAARISPGKAVYLTTPAAPDIVAVGEVTALNPQIKTHNRAVEITVEFDNPGGWLPGASVDATVVVEERAAALTVPEMAVVKRSGRHVVFRVLSGEAQAVPVSVGWREDGWVEITRGVGIEDVVVTEGAGLISDGTRVELL